MKSPIILAVSLAACASATPGIAQSNDPAVGRPPPVKAVIDYSRASSGQADAFFKALGRQAGKKIFLMLELVPKQGTEGPGYGLRKDGAPEREKNVVRRIGNAGNVDNYLSSFRLSFQHPEHFHAPTEIVIGDRRRYPFHSIRCGTDTVKELTPLHISGHFVVMMAEIPTANSYTLYPFAP